MQVMGARAFDNLIHNTEVEAALLRLKLLPVDWRGQGVGVQSGHRLPHLRQLAGPCAGVVNLAAENQVRPALDKQSVAAIFLHQSRRFNGQSQRKRDGSKEKASKKIVKSGNAHKKSLLVVT